MTMSTFTQEIQGEQGCGNHHFGRVNINFGRTIEQSQHYLGSQEETQLIGERGGLFEFCAGWGERGVLH